MQKYYDPQMPYGFIDTAQKWVQRYDIFSKIQDERTNMAILSMENVLLRAYFQLLKYNPACGAHLEAHLSWDEERWEGLIINKGHLKHHPHQITQP